MVAIMVILISECMMLANLYIYIALMPAIKFQFNPTCGFRDAMLENLKMAAILDI